jgi:hypothetical protein
MKIEGIKKIAPISKDKLFRPLRELSEEEKESIYYCDIADAELECR